MRLHYLGPISRDNSYPALTGFDPEIFSNNCYAFEVLNQANFDWALTEGDVLVVDELRMPCHGDLAVALVDGYYRVVKISRCGHKLRLFTANGGNSILTSKENLKGIVISQFRRYVL